MSDRAEFVEEMHTVENLRCKQSDAFVGYWRCSFCPREEVTKSWFTNPRTGYVEYVMPRGWTREDGITRCDGCAWKPHKGDQVKWENDHCVIHLVSGDVATIHDAGGNATENVSVSELTLDLAHDDFSASYPYG